MVHKSFCNKSNMKPRGDIRDCNQKPCPPPMYVIDLWNRAVKVDGMRLRISSDVPYFFCIVLQLGDRGVAELQQALRENRDASPLGQLRSAAGRQHHAHHPQQALQRQPAWDAQILQPTPLSHPVEGWTLVPGRQAEIQHQYQMQWNEANRGCKSAFWMLWPPLSCVDLFTFSVSSAQWHAVMGRSRGRLCATPETTPSACVWTVSLRPSECVVWIHVLVSDKRPLSIPVLPDIRRYDTEMFLGITKRRK